LLAPHIIFDFDGTLIDSSPAILETLGAVLHARGIAPARPLDRALIGPPLHATLQACTGITDKQVLEELADDFRKRYDTEGLYATQAYEGTAAVLQQLMAAGSRLHIATNKRQRPTLLLLAHFGWESWFRSVYCVDSHEPPYASKGQMLLAQVREQKLDPGDTIYIGDTRHDEVAAAQAGLPFIAAGWGYGIGEQAVSKAARLLHCARDLLTEDRR
jgi:phosphoglycolate phosphatase